MTTPPTYRCAACSTTVLDTSRPACANCGVDFTKVMPTLDAQVGSPSAVVDKVGDAGSAREAPADPLVAPPGAIVQAVASGGSRRGWIILGSVIFAAILAAAGFIGLTESGALTPHHTITGDFQLNSSDFSGITVIGTSCQGKSGYGDIVPGAGVTIKDGDGKLLAATSLGSGTGNVMTCDFKFSLTNVPEVAFYTITISRRGDLSYSLAQMQSNSWTLSLTLGS